MFLQPPGRIRPLMTVCIWCRQAGQSLHSSLAEAMLSWHCSATVSNHRFLERRPFLLPPSPFYHPQHDVILQASVAPCVVSIVTKLHLCYQWLQWFRIFDLFEHQLIRLSHEPWHSEISTPTLQLECSDLLTVRRLTCLSFTAIQGHAKQLYANQPPLYCGGFPSHRYICAGKNLIIFRLTTFKRNGKGKHTQKGWRNTTDLSTIANNLSSFENCKISTLPP